MTRRSPEAWRLAEELLPETARSPADFMEQRRKVGLALQRWMSEGDNAPCAARTLIDAMDGMWVPTASGDHLAARIARACDAKAPCRVRTACKLAADLLPGPADGLGFACQRQRLASKLQLFMKQRDHVVRDAVGVLHDAARREGLNTLAPAAAAGLPDARGDESSRSSQPPHWVCA